MLSQRKGKKRAKGAIDVELLTELTPGNSPQRRLLMQYEAARLARDSLRAASDAQGMTANLIRFELKESYGTELPEDVT